MPKYKPLYSLYKGLRESKYDVPDSYASFQKTLTQAGNAGAKSRRGLYQSLKDSNYDVHDTYEDFYKNFFVPVNSTTSRALKIGENPNTPTVNRYRQKMFDSVDPNKNGLNNLSNRAVGQAVRATNNVRKPVIAKVVNQKGKPTGKEFAITPAKTAEDLDREYAQETTKNWENELHDQIADADKDAAKISDMFKSFIGSTDEVGSVWGNMTRGGGIAGTPHSVTTNNGILENTEARQILAAGDYNRKRRELLQLEQDSRNGAIFDNHSFFRGMYDAAKDTGFLTGGASDLINAGSLLATKQDLDNGVHTEAGDMLMQQAVKNSNAQSQYGDNQGWMYIGGVITTNLAPFMVQIGSAGFSKGMSNAIGKVVQGTASKVALGTMEKATGMVGAHIANYIGKVTGLTTKAFGKAVQYGIVGAAQANTVGLGNVANDVINRYTGQVYQDEQGSYKFGTFDSDGNLVHEGGEDFLTALVKGEAAQTIEFATELAGGGIDAAGTALKNFVTKGGKKIINKYNMENVSKVIDFLLNNKVSKNARYLKAGADRTLGKVEVNSIVGESLEEELGIIANTVFTGDNKISDLWDEKQQSQIWGGMLLSIGLMKGAVVPFHAYNAKQYYSYKHKLDKADVNLSQLLGKEKWEELRNQIDATTNDDMPEMVNKINRDVALGKNRQPVREYIQNLLIMRGYDIGNMLAAKKAVEDKGEGVSVKNMEKNQAYQQGRDAYGYDTHEIQLDQEDKQKSLAQLLGISEQQLASMSDEELEELSGRDDNIDRAIYDYQLSTARYEGVVDNARDQIDLEVQRAAQAVDMYTDKSRNTIRNATIKATGGLEDYGVYIINGNIATHDDGSINISNSDDMILYYDPTTNTVEHADAMMFAELGSEENADEVRSQAMADAKEKAIKETTGIIDGVVEVGTQFKTVDADGTEHTYEVLADNGDGTAMITIDGNVPTELVKGENVNVPVSFEELQKMKDASDQQRLQAAKAQREQMEKERAEQQNQETEQTQPSFDFNQILNDNGNVVLADVLDNDGNTKYPNSQLFLIRDSGAKAKVVELKSDGTIVPHAVNKEDVATSSSMSLDEYKQAMLESSMIEDNSGEESDEDSQLANLGLPKGSEIWMSGDGFGRPKESTLSRVLGIDEQGSIILEDKDGKKWSASFDYINNHRELPPLDENANIVNEENNQSESNAEENTPAPEQTPAITLEDGTIVPMLEDGNPDFSKLTAEQTAELYDSQFGEDADSVISGWVSDAKKALDKASNMTVKGKTFVEQKAAKQAKEKAIADAQAAYDSAIAIRDAYNERQLAKVEDTAEGRKELIEKARRKFARLKSAVKDDAEAVSQIYRDTIGSLLHRLYDSTGIDVTDTIPLTAEEYVASNLGAHSLNYEGTETSKGVKQETGLSREDFAKTQLLAADGKGTTIDALVHSLWENRPSNLESLDTQDIRNALIGVLNSGFKASEARNFVENIRIAQAENILEEQKRAQENADYAEQHKAEPEAELKAKSDEKAELKAKSEEKLDNESDNKSNDLSNESDNENINDNINDNINTLTPEQQKAKEDGEKLGFPAVDKEGEPINEYVVELAEWAKEQGLEIDPTSKLNSYADLFLMCKDGFGVSTLVPDEGENINQVVYFPDNVQDFDQLWKLQEEFNAGRDLKHSSNIDSEITEGATFYDADTAREFKEFVDKKVEEQNKVFGEQRPEEDLPFSAKENGKQQTTAERAADVDKNKVDDMKVVDNIVGQKTRKAFERLAKMMGANIQWQYSDKLGNGWIQETKDADGNVHRTIFITLDSSITEGAQFIFGHEMTHQIKKLNPAAYNELTQLVLDTYGSDVFDKAVDETMQRYSDAGFSGRARDYYAEEVVADAVGEMIRDLNLAHTLAMKMSHPLLAAIHEILQKIKLAFFGTEYSDVTKNIIRSIEQAYVKTAKGEVTNSETGEDISFSLRQKPEPKKKGIGYKVFVLKDGKLYPPMVANPDGAATPVGVWLDADAAPIAGESKTGRPQVKQGGKGTQGGSGKLAYRPGWHLGVVPYAIQFNRKDAEGNKTLFPKNFVFAEVEYAADVDYQEEARQEGINPSGKYQHSLAGLKYLPTDGYYMYRTNPNPETDPWVITGAMKVNRILTRAEQAELVKNAGREPQQIQEGDIVTDDVVNSINQEIADAPKFSLKDIKPVGVGAFGNIYNQFRGKAKAAIEFLKKLGSGEATAALHHHTIGDISLVWGDKKTGLDKILRKHPEVVDNLQSIIDSMEVVQESDNRIKLESPTHFAVVSKEYKGEPREQWLLTAYEKRESLENGKSMDTATSSLGGDTALSQSKESAAKIDNSSETAKENGEKFSLKDEKTLAGVHNISEEKLLKAIKQGGLANPSVAVIDSSRQDHKAYGGISLILPSDKIAKRTGKNAGTWQGDAYTPTYPEVEKQMSNKGAEKSSSDVLSVPKEMQHEVRNGIDRWLNGSDANSGLKYLFLHEKGVAPEPKKIQPKFSDEAYNELKFITAGDFNIYGIGNADTQKVLDMYIEAKFDGDKDLYEEKTKAWLERNKSIVDTGAKGGMRYAIAKENVELYDEYGFNYKGVQTFVRDVEYDHRKSGVDTNATLNDVEDYIKTNNLTDEFNTWLEGKEKEYGIKEVIFDGFTPSGNRRYVPNTLENVSKIMKKQGRNGATGAAVSFQNFAARLMPSYGTLKDIRSKKDLLTSDREKFDKFREKWSNVFFELGNKCQPDSTSAFDSYGMERLSEAAMTSDPQAYLKKEYNVDFSDEDTKRLKEMVKAIKEEHPAMYFETKFERPVRFDEFSAAVVPTTTKKEVKEALKNAGVSIFEYDEKSDADRKRAFNEAINSSDNIRFSLKAEKEKIVADAKANGTYMTAPNGEKTKLDAEQWATVRTTNFKNWFGDWENEPENASKVVDENGEPMVVWHGRSAEFNTFEKKEGVRFIMGLEDKVKAEGFFFSPDKGLAEEFASNSSRHRGGKANVVPCFLNIRKPMDLTGEDYDRIYEDVTGWEYMVGMDTQDNLWGIMDEEGMADKIKEKGYDGAIFVEEVDDSYEPTKISFCALDANQIKSAENNNGDFSADNNDIRFSLKSMMEKPEGWKQANKKAIHIAEAIERDPKFSLKNLDGTLIKAGTYFSGGGLVEEGLKGIIDPVVAVEYDEKISGVYRNNFGQHIVTADVRDVDPRELVKQIDGEVEYFHASPVCKNYSQAKSNHTEVELDKETAASTAEFINAIKPKVVTIENVKGYKDSEAMKTITDALDANGYTWDADVYNAADYGGYTNRERLIVRAVRDGKLPDKPKRMAHKRGWYEAVADIIPTLTEKKNGVAPWMDVRLKADGIDWRNIDKPLYVMGSAYADGKVPHAFADELLPTLRTKSGDVIVMPDGKVYRAMGRVLARVSGVSDDYKMPFSENLSHTIIGNGIPTQLTEHVIAPLLTGSDPKFSIRAYHGTGVSFDKFDLSHAFEGEGSETFGHGVYVTNSKKIGDNYAQRAKDRKGKFGFDYKIDMSADAGQMLSHYINKNQDVDKGLENARQDLKSALKMFPDDETLKELSAILQKNNNEIAEASNEAYLYDVDIPDDNGENYLGWNESQNFPLEKWYRLWEITHHGFNENEYFKDGGANYDKDRIERIIQMKLDSPENGMQKLPTLKGEELYHALEDFFDRERPLRGAKLASRALSEIGFVGIKYPAGMIHGGAVEGDYNYVIFDENNANIVGNTRFSLRYDQFEHDLNQWKKDNNLPKDAQRPTIPQRNAGESAVDFLKRVDEYRKQMALWKTAPTYEQHLLSDDTALGEFNRELQRGSVLKRIAFQDSMLAIRKAQKAIMKEVGVDRLNMAEDAYTAENRSHGKGKNEFEEYNNEFLQPLRKAYHQMKKILGDSYDNVRIYMMAKHGLERDAQMAFKKSLEADYEDVAQRSAAYKAYKGDMNRIINDSDLEFGRVDFTTWRQRDNALRAKYSPSYMDYRYDKNGIVYDYSGLSALFGGSDFEEAAHKLVRDIESNHVAEVHDLWDATNAATKKILRDGYKAGMMSKDTYQYVRDMYSHYIPLRGWDGTTADQVWDYIGGGKGAFNQTLKKAHGRTSIADDPIAYIENMAESGILLNNKNWVKQHLMLLAQNHPTSLLTLSKAWYVKSMDDNGNEEWIPATPQITSQMNSNQVKADIDAFEKKMEQMAQTGDATQKRDGLNIAYPQTHSEEREHEVRVMKDGEEYVIYVNGDPQLAQAMNNTRAHRVREIQSGKLDRAAAWLGRKMAAAYTSLSPLFIPSNYFRDLTMTLASTAIREDAKYNYLLGKNLTTSWNLGFMLKDYQNGKLREKVSNGNATPKEQMFYDFMMNGGETGFVSSLDVEDLKKKFKNDLKDLDRWKVNPVKVGHTIMDCIEFLNRMIEDSNRFAIYMTSIQYGRSIDEAVNDAKDVTLNFNRKGTGEYGWQMIRNLYLFINPAVQSLQTLGALAKHHPFKFTAVTASWLASGVLVPIVNVALMQLGAAFLGGDGDDDKDWYKDISKKYWQFTKWDRRNNFIMWVPTTHEFVKIPLAQEFRAFYGLGDMIASKMMGGELAEESWEDYGWDLVGQVVDMLPLDPTGYDGELGVSLMPNPIRPVFELAFNVDFTGKPLFKDTEYNKYDPNFTKAYVGTPDWLVRASRMMNSIGNDYPNVQQNKWDALGNPRYNLNNPAVVDHVLSSYLGGAYTMGSQVLGLLTKSLNDRKKIKVADIPLVSKFVSNPDDRPVSKKQGDEFWDKKEYYDRVSNTISKLKKQAKIDGDYSLLERFYGSEEYKTYKLYEKDVKDYNEARKKERAEESGDEYRPHQLNAEDIYNNHATPMDEFEDMKLKQLFEKLNSFKTRYDAIVDNAPNESDGYYNTNKAAIDAIDEISIDKQEISELKKGFLDDGKDAYNAEDMKQIRDLRKKILAVLEKANKVIVVNQKAKAEK